MRAWLRCACFTPALFALFLACVACNGTYSRNVPWAPEPPDEVVGAVAADHPEASRAGVAILNQGGNAVDAAVATSFALSVVRPYSCGIGGGGFMVIHLVDDPRTPGRVDPIDVAIDYRERAPGAVNPDHFVGLAPDASRYSGHAVAVPGTVAGLLHALGEFGSLDRATVMAPAIALAQDGYTIDNHAWEAMVAHAERRGEPAYDRPVRINNPGQARALRAIAASGAPAFYEGEIAQALISTVRGAGGVMTLGDLASFEPKEVEPIVRTIDGWDGHTFITMPPPSSGGIAIIQMLTMLAQARDLSPGPVDEDYLATVERSRTDGDAGRARAEAESYWELTHRTHLLIEAMKFAFADRAAYLGDPEFSDVPVDALVDERYLRERAEMIDSRWTHPPAYYTRDGAGGVVPPDAGTSHFCVIDAQGNAVSCTETINLVYGSRIEVRGYGFYLNNEMDDFATRPGEPNAFGLIQSARNAPEPGKRPLSSMSPTIVLDDKGRVEVIAGASGGPRIITGTLQVVLNAMEGWPVGWAVEMPRLHHQWLPDVVRIEREELAAVGQYPHWDVLTDGQKQEVLDDWDEFVAETFAGLAARGHAIEPIPAVGHVQVIRRMEDGRYEIASDPRKGGEPAYADR